jgi:hypothetical protein
MLLKVQRSSHLRAWFTILEQSSFDVVSSLLSESLPTLKFLLKRRRLTQLEWLSTRDFSTSTALVACEQTSIDRSQALVVP